MPKISVYEKSFSVDYCGATFIKHFVPAIRIGLTEQLGLSRMRSVCYRKNEAFAAKFNNFGCGGAVDCC